MENFLLYSQILVSLLLIVSILLQQRGEGLSSAFGGGGGGGDMSYGTRRGLQQKIFISSIVLGSSFIILTLLNLLF